MATIRAPIKKLAIRNDNYYKSYFVPLTKDIGFLCIIK